MREIILLLIVLALYGCKSFAGEVINDQEVKDAIKIIYDSTAIHDHNKATQFYTSETKFYEYSINGEDLIGKREYDDVMEETKFYTEKNKSIAGVYERIISEKIQKNSHGTEAKYLREAMIFVKNKKIHYKYTAVFVKRNGKLQIIEEHNYTSPTEEVR